MLALTSALLSVQLSVAGPCPDAAAVAARLLALEPAAPRSAADRDRALVVQEADGLLVELRRPDGALLARRSLAAAQSCADRADAVAVTLAAWEAALPSGVSGALPPPSRGGSDGAASDAVSALTAAAPRPSQLTWSADVAFLASIAGGSFAAGATGDVRLGRRAFPLAGHLGLAGMDSRDVGLGSGHVAWSRAALTLGPTLALPTRAVQLELHADFAAGILFLQGQGFAVNHAEVSFDPALGGGVRLALARWDFAPFVDVTLLGWLRTQSASASEPAGTYSATLPRLDIWLRAGLAYGRRK